LASQIYCSTSQGINSSTFLLIIKAPLSHTCHLQSFDSASIKALVFEMLALNFFTQRSCSEACNKWSKLLFKLLMLLHFRLCCLYLWSCPLRSCEKEDLIDASERVKKEFD